MVVKSFIILLPETTQEHAFKIAETIRKNSAIMEILYNDKMIKNTISIGIKTVTTVKENESIENLLNHADKALYQAKSNGRNQTCIYENISHKIPTL